MLAVCDHDEKPERFPAPAIRRDPGTARKRRKGTDLQPSMDVGAMSRCGLYIPNEPQTVTLKPTLTMAVCSHDKKTRHKAGLKAPTQGGKAGHLRGG